jgi:signal transduction histidine kinase/AraC-like DNA-binding protein
MGYQALRVLYEHLVENTGLGETTKVDTRLVARESCGCERGNILTSQLAENRDPHLVNRMSTVILNQAYNLTDDALKACCEQLLEPFADSVEKADAPKFEDTLLGVLRKTASVGDDIHIWQDAISLLRMEFVEESQASDAINAILDNARRLISDQTQRQYQQYVLNERRISSRLSLLTDRLLGALDETQIYDILANNLPDLGVQTAQLATFEPEGDDPVAWSIIRDVINTDRPHMRFKSRDFPPAGLFVDERPSILTLIPLVSHTAQFGYAVFGSEPLDLFGAIVQQLGGAFNTARLYRQAVEDRRLAEEANKMKSRFLSTISHELRTPLNLIVGLSGIMLQENEDGSSSLPNSAQRDVERIHAYSQHLGGLIGDVLDLASSDAGQLKLRKEFLDLGEVLNVVSESGRQLASDKGLSWQVNLPEKSLWVFGDRTRLRQVGLNLVNNAIKFTASGEVSLRVELGDGTVTVSVHDTGLGIPPEDQEVIFNEFDRSQRSVLLGYSGLGLGLAICKRLVEMHAGTIGVHSSGEEGSGSTFYFSLPVVQPPADHTKQRSEATKDQRVIIVVTDQPESSADLFEQLNAHGYTLHITEIRPNPSWLPGLFEMEPDAILLDAGLASNHGWDSLRSIKEHPSVGDIPVLFYRSTQDKGSFLELDLITKPIELETLTRMLDHQWLMSSTDRPLRTVLVVDDDINTLEMHARIVQSHSALNRVLMAHNGGEALKILGQENVDLVLLDLQMPEMDGFAVLSKMRENVRTQKVPVIVVTGRVLTEADMASLNQGVAAILEKGLFSLDETVAHIDIVLERKRRLSRDAQRLIRKAMAYIHEHYSEPISRRDIAQHVSFAEDYLTYCFRQELGTTPIKYLQRYRLNQACHLLLDSDKTITEIALKVGFTDAGYFSRLFHREIGVSPDKYRNKT